MPFFKKQDRSPRTAAIIAAGGNSTRMGSDKLMARLAGEPVLWHTLLAFERCDAVDEVIVSAREELIPELLALSRDRGLKKLRSIVKGGKTRQQSVYRGALVCSDDIELLCVHDGARPLVDVSVIEAVLLAASQFGAATASVPLKDTVKQARDGFAVATPPRDSLVAVQTPQAFTRALYLKAYEATRCEYSDDCQLIEACGGRVALVQGDYANIKLTTPEDFAVAEALLQWRKLR